MNAEPGRAEEVFWKRESLQDRFAITLLVCLPIVFFWGPARGGRAYLAGDNLYQNLPLRVLVGRLIREGQLPLWNALQWSGTPLLAGFNAGAAYPGSWLFALLKPLAAWTLNAMAVYVVAGTGMYLLLRSQKLQPIAAFLGTATATFAGFLPGQYVHLALVQGMSWAPWVLLALDRLAETRAPRWGFWLLLCVSGGLVELSGEPRAVCSVAIVCAIYLIGLFRTAPLRKQLALAALTAAPVIFALGAVQLLPGISFIQGSQRGHVDYGFFAESPTWESLPRLFTPYFKVFYATWAYPYWDTEAWGYVGLLPIAAALTFAFWRKQARGRPGTWLSIALVGLVLSLAGPTPLGHLLHHLPFYGNMRGQSRNLALVDLGLAGLFACWADDWITRSAPVLSRRMTWLYRGLALLAPLLVASAVVAMAVLPVQHLSFFGISKRSFLLLPTLPIAVAYGAVTFLRPLRTELRALCLAVVVLLDLNFALGHLDRGTIPFGPLFASTSTSASISEALGKDGRFLNFDPPQSIHSFLGFQLTPDLPLLQHLRSAQGLGSIVDGTYDGLTHAHTWRSFLVTALGDETADDLNLQLVLVPATTIYQRSQPNVAKIRAALSAPHWKELPHLDDFTRFQNTRAKGRAWLEPAEAVPDPLPAGNAVEAPAAPEAAPGHVKAVITDDQDGETDQVSTSEPTLLVRSVAFADGWTATLRDAQGHLTTLTAMRHRTVQAVLIPAGDFTVTWVYAPLGVKLGLWLSGSSAVALSALGFGLLFLWLRARLLNPPALGTAPSPSPSKGAAHA